MVLGSDRWIAILSKVQEQVGGYINKISRSIQPQSKGQSQRKLAAQSYGSKAGCASQDRQAAEIYGEKTSPTKCGPGTNE